MKIDEFAKYSEARLFSLGLFEELPIHNLSSQYYVDALREIINLINPIQDKKFILSDEKVTRVK
jgi:hypothetical protein